MVLIDLRHFAKDSSITSSIQLHHDVYSNLTSSQKERWWKLPSELELMVLLERVSHPKVARALDKPERIACVIARHALLVSRY